jgi:hypothetical protein
VFRDQNKGKPSAATRGRSPGAPGRPRNGAA